MSEVKSEEVQQEHAITNLTSKQQRFIHLYITGQYTIPKLAELMNVDARTLRGWLKREDVKEIIESFQEEEHELVEHAIKNMRLKAIQKMTELIDSPIDGVALSACKDILDRSGHKPTQKVEKNVTITSYEQQMKDLIDECIDVDYVEGS